MTTCARLGVSILLAAAPALAQTIQIPNPSFEKPGDPVASWTLSGPGGAWLDDAAQGQRAIATEGTGSAEDASYWRSQALDLEPGRLYMQEFHARRYSGSEGCPITGPVFCNRDLVEARGSWQRYRSAFRTPDDLRADGAWLRFGQYDITGRIGYDAVAVTAAQAIHRTRGGLTLGAGETVRGDRYMFDAPMSAPHMNDARPLARHTAFFNTNRWVFGAGSEVVYRHQIGAVPQTAGTVRVNMGYYVGGALVIEASNDGAAWREIGRTMRTGDREIPLPEKLFPADRIWVRLRSQRAQELGPHSDPGSFQVMRYGYEAQLADAPGDLYGVTTYAAIRAVDPRLGVEMKQLGQPGGDGAAPLVLAVESDDTAPRRLEAEVAPLWEDAPEARRASILVEPGAQELVLESPLPALGEGVLRVSLGAFRAEVFASTPAYRAASYGKRLPGSNARAGLWSASSGWKIPPNRGLPAAESEAIALSAARNEAESVQLVVTPAKDLRDVRVTTTALEGPGGATLPASAIEVRRVGYVRIGQPTDETGLPGPWPDPLFPLNEPLLLDAGRSHPFWLTLTTPDDAPAGTYRGRVAIEADGYAAQTPLELRVYDFTLPDRMTCVTAFGFDPYTAWRYHGAAGEEEKREILEAYLACLSRHHISPYDPAPLDPFQVTWPATEAWDGGERVEVDGGYALRLEDPGAGNVHGETREMPIPAEGVRIRFRYKTGAPGHRTNVALGHYDAGGAWLSGRNTDISLTGDGTWQTFDKTVTDFPPGAVAFTFSVFAAQWTEDGGTTGSLLMDDLLITDAGSGERLYEAGYDPLDPAALEPEFDWTEWDAAMERAFGRYHFNSFRVPIQGIGGGTFHHRVQPSLLGYPEGTPQYDAAFTNYCQAVQEHLRDRGWLDEGFVYWFDEPQPRDYDFVRTGFERLEAAAPDIRGMLTEQPEPGLYGAPDIWCPISYAWDDKRAQERMAAGDAFWWYVCTGPKAPYATLFIDHPGTEMRVWLWQTWKRGIDGVLAWQTNYWTSPYAYPDGLQNPYEDPMSWVSGYGIERGQRLPWGNGDGRFLYPPLAAADGPGETPVLEPPVPSIRLAMLRDGIEDYEYLKMLSALLKEKGKVMGEAERKRLESLLDLTEITQSLTEFAIDPAPLVRRRHAIAQAIESLSAK